MRPQVFIFSAMILTALLVFSWRPGNNKTPIKSIATASSLLAADHLPSPVVAAAPLQPRPVAAVDRELDARLNPYAAGLRAPGKSKRAWAVTFFDGFQKAKSGDPIRFELTEGLQAVGSIRITQFSEAGALTYFSGELTAPEAGKFFFLEPPEGGKAGKAVGVIEFPGSHTAYRIEPTGPNGEPELWQRRLDEVLCVGMEPVTPSAGADTNLTADAPPLRPDAAGNNVPTYNTNKNGVALISLQSNPGSKAVLLLDFFGGYTATWGGVPYSVPAAANNVTIKEVWKRVAEDFQPFNINVTTDIKIYQAAPASSRQRCCFTDTPVTPAGVAYIGSWNWGSDTPCWSVYTTGKNGAEVGAHEPGHTLGLGHQGQGDSTGTTNEYYGGQGSGATGWSPTMGVGYYQNVSSWAKGEYHFANNTQDELNTITTANNNVAYRADDTGSTLATSRYLEVYPDSSVFAEGVIERTADTDAFQFTTTGGTISLMAAPVGDWSNLAIAATLADATDTVIVSNNPQTTLYAIITTNLPAGTYTFRITGAGRNDPLTTGFSSYASLGYYSISGFVTGARQANRFDVMEHSANGTVVGTVIAADTNSPLAYAILSGNLNSTFAVDTNGVITVANSAALDYTALATNTALAVQYEIFVNITNLNDPLLTELNRRVVIGVQSVSNSYPIAATGYNAGVIAAYNATAATPKATGFDLANNYCFYQAGLFGNAQVSGSGGLQGLPASGLLVSRQDGATFKFGPYGGTNALMLGSTYPIAGKLTLAQPRAYNSLTFLASSANGGGVGSCFVTFTNGTKSRVFNFNDQDWFNTTTNVALSALGRLRLGQATLPTEDNGFSNPNFYQTTLNLAAIGSNLMVASITFTNASGQNSGVFALSGLPMADAVAITGQPLSLTNIVPTQAGTLAVVAMGTPPLFCQWYQGNPGTGTALVNQTNFNLTFTPVQATNAGSYYAIVTNSVNAATSSVATVTVYREPQITAQTSPPNSIKFVGQKNTFAVSATAATPVNYFWRINGTNISSATATNYTLTNLQLTNTGSYVCFISNAFGMVTSSIASLTVVASNYPYAQRVIVDHPLGYWRLDEASGPMAHDYVGTNNGIFTNVLLSQTGNNLIDTHKAPRFGSVASVNSFVGGIPIDFGTTNYTANTNGEFSVEAWVNGGTQTTDAGIMTKGYGGGGEQFNLDCGGTSHAFRFFVRENGGAAHLATSSVTPNNQWHHLVGVCDQSNAVVLLYVDGALSASGTIATNVGILDSTNPVSFGSRQSGAGTAFNNQFLGLMEELAIYNYPLSAAQVLAHFVAVTNRAPVFVANPIFKPNVNAGQFYSASLATNASDPNGDAITYAKVSGPTWLNVANNGSLTGTAANNDANTNSFVVSARDATGLSNTASLFIYVNGAPAFWSDPFTNITLVAGQNYAGSLASFAADPNPVDVLSFAKVGGPLWLNVASDGTLTGQPLSADVGTNSFVVRVNDPASLNGSATMTVVVTSAPAIASAIGIQNGNVVLNWTGGIGPFTVQVNSDLTNNNWQTIATNLSQSVLQVSPTNDAAFYRVIGQ